MNPYESPSPGVAAARRRRHPALILMNGLAVGTTLSVVFELPSSSLARMNGNSIPMLASLASIAGCVMLFTAILSMLNTPKSATLLFLGAAGLLSLTAFVGFDIPGWMRTPIGVPVALAGVILTHRIGRQG